MNFPISFLIISEDKETINIMLKEFEDFPDFKYEGNSKRNHEAGDLILKKRPNLVFLDLDNECIADPFRFVLDLYQYLDHIPEFIAISQSKDLAYEVIKGNFIDYLLKPFLTFELRKCVMKLEKTRNASPQKICVKSYSDYQFLDLAEVLYLKADNNTTDFYLSSGLKISAYKTLKYFEERLPSYFVRVHHSYILNSHLVGRINFGKAEIILRVATKHTHIPFSKSYRENVNSLRENLLQDQFISFQN